MTTEERRVALVIMAHPDDAEFGCAGTVALWVRQGWEVHYVVCTDASGGGSDDATDVSLAARQQITATRKAEQRAAAAILGVHEVQFLDLPDGRIQPTLEFRGMIVRLLRQIRPTRVVCQSPDRSWKQQYSLARHHPDHLAVGAATISAIYPASQNPWDFPELLAEGLLPHKVRELYVMGAPEQNMAVDISDTIDLKLQALRAHDSQVGARFADLEVRIRQWAAENGALYDVPCAEIFHRTENP